MSVLVAFGKFGKNLYMAAVYETSATAYTDVVIHRRRVPKPGDKHLADKPTGYTAAVYPVGRRHQQTNLLADKATR